MAKASIPGNAKTRLCPPLTFEESAAFNTAFLKDIAENLIVASAEASIAGSMAYGPPGSKAFFRAHMPASIALHEVWLPDFGACLMEALRLQFAAGHRAACVLNSEMGREPAFEKFELKAANPTKRQTRSISFSVPMSRVKLTRLGHLMPIRQRIIAILPNLGLRI